MPAANCCRIRRENDKIAGYFTPTRKKGEHTLSKLLRVKKERDMPSQNCCDILSEDYLTDCVFKYSWLQMPLNASGGSGETSHIPASSGSPSVPSPTSLPLTLYAGRFEYVAAPKRKYPFPPCSSPTTPHRQCMRQCPSCCFRSSSPCLLPFCSKPSSLFPPYTLNICRCVFL